MYLISFSLMITFYYSPSSYTPCSFSTLDLYTYTSLYVVFDYWRVVVGGWHDLYIVQAPCYVAFYVE